MLNIGLLSLFLFNFLTAMKGVYLSSFLQKVPVFLILSVCFSLVTLSFIIINVFADRGKKTVLLISKKYWLTIVGLNISALMGWTGYYYALKLLEPAVVTSLTAASGPVITACFLSVTRKEKKYSKIEWSLFLGLVLIMGYLVVESYLGYSAVRHISWKQSLIGTFAAFICGVANVTNTLLSKRLNTAGLTSRQIIPFRFYLLILFGSFFCSTQEWQLLNQADVLLSILTLSFFGVAIPIFLIQVGIEKTDPMTVANVHATLPIFVLTVQLFDQRLVMSHYSVVGTIGLTLLSMISISMKFTSNRPTRRM